MPVITDSHHPGQCLRNIPACPPGRSCPGEPHHVQARARRPLCSHRRGGEWRERVQQQHQHRLQRDHLQRERSKLQFEWKSQQLEASALCAKTTAASVRRLKPLSTLSPTMHPCQRGVPWTQDAAGWFLSLWDCESVGSKGGEEEGGGGGGESGLPANQQAPPPPPPCPQHCCRHRGRSETCQRTCRREVGRWGGRLPWEEIAL